MCLARPPAVGDSNSDPIAYLNRALDEMQTRALRRASVDWAKLRAKRKGHSVSDDAGRPAADYSAYVGRYEPAGQLERLQHKLFASVVVTKCFPENDRQLVQFETRVQAIIAELDHDHPMGWIVDLRGNVGGNMWPMLAGLGPLLGESDNLGEFFNTDGQAFWEYSAGAASQFQNGKRYKYPPVDGKPYVLASRPPVAVLIDHSTGSSGEAVAIAFHGRPQTRFFGEHTAGVSTVNETFALSDGASLWLTIGVQADRTGTQIPDGIAPDEVIPTGKQILPDAQDPVIQAALRWLSGSH